MYDVMIVDDEEPVLDSFAFIMEQGVESFRLCGRARSGLEAIQMAESLKPDLIFMDIHMPGMDGLEAIRQIRETNKMVLFILATAYERFDIARQAIQLNVLNYLVKPITRKKIMEELDRARKKLDKQARKRQMFMGQTRQTPGGTEPEELDFVRSLSGPLSEEEGEELKTRWNIPSGRGRICLLHYDGEGSISEKQDYYRRIKEKLLFKYRCFLSFSGDRGVIFVPGDGDGFGEGLEGVLRDISLQDVTIGLGGLYPLQEMHLSWEDAMEPFILAEEDEQLYELEQMGRIMDLAEQGEREEFRESLTYFADSVFNSRSLLVALAKMNSMFSLVLGRLGYFDRGAGKALPFLPAEEIMVLKSREEWDAWFHHARESLVRILVPRDERELPTPLRRAEKFISREYGNQIYLGSVAEECGVSASYLSRLFSEHLNMPFTDYLNRYRVDRAAELLKGGAPVKEAAYKVGFGDPGYFSKIFRKFTGISPSEL
ncbi:MAG: helix-turn-helix domain-containing protein [Spirochaetales bacterium]|nr:helix-turn-helix domain-containing protein [Spirochaetales bacterium]